MLKHLAILSLAISTTLAQSSSNDNSPIPSGISSSCNQFMTELNNNATLSACTTPLLTATKQFGAGESASQSDVTNALNTICSPATASACPDSLMRGKLADFYAQCAAELTTQSNSGVLGAYDVLYALSPFRQALCTKDDSDNYCVLKKKTSGSKSAIATDDKSQGILQYLANSQQLQHRADTPTMTPNMTTFRDNNILFDFLQPSMSSDELCTSCTRQIFNSYFKFETLVSYAPGMARSMLLGGQMDLYKAINSTCGPDFLQTSVQAAGGISGGTLFSGATQNANGPVTAALGLISLAIISFF